MAVFAGSHIWVCYRSLEELQIQPDAISGVSAGAIVGALYAAGHSPQKIRDILKKEFLFRLVELSAECRWPFP